MSDGAYGGLGYFHEDRTGVSEYDDSDDLAARTQELELEATRVFLEVAGSSRLGLPALTPDSRGVFGVVDPSTAPFTARVEFCPLPGAVMSRSHVNTTSGNHVIQLSDQMAVSEVKEFLAQELRVLVAVRDRATTGEPPPRRNVLNQGLLTHDSVLQLTDEDLGLLARFDVLANSLGQNTAGPASREESENRLLTLIDEGGLRPLAADSSDTLSQEQTSVRWRRALIQSELSPTGRQALQELGRPVEELPSRQAEQVRANQNRRSGNPTLLGPEQPMPGLAADGSPITMPELPAALERAHQARNDRSALTLSGLRAEIAAGGSPSLPVMIGGGAALQGRDASTLVVNARGRWHVDPITAIVQSADQVRHLYTSGIGDPYQFAEPRQRLPLEAIQLWQDTLAARGPLIDGQAELTIDEQGRLAALIRPSDGSELLTVQVEGQPVIATGVPPEIVPGASRQVPTVSEAAGLLAQHLATARPELAQEVLDTAASGAAVRLRTLAEEHDLPAQVAGVDKLGEAMTTINATATWQSAREQAPGRVLFGDEVGEGEYDPQIADRWLLAGVGGAAIANAEIILQGNPEATVTLVGTEVPTVLENDAQHLALRRAYDETMGGDGRLVLVTGKRLGAVETAEDAAGHVTVHAAGVEADAYVACLGRVPRLPPALAGLQQQTQAQGGEVTGEVLFDDDRQYLGYQLNFRTESTTREVLVTGAASRMPPPDIFSRDQIDRVNRAGDYEAPLESGNVAAGFMASAGQASRLKAATRIATGDGDRERVLAQWQSRRGGSRDGAQLPGKGTEPVRTEPKVGRTRTQDENPRPTPEPGRSPKL